ncbi:MAG TPA: DNA mismatch repair protein MutT [Parvularcula sp.]|nr:DNA mismatch repair protein MutT [Parvularcula sp.]HBS30483.1 DNA mismatch repair protein MutT [Parvularcula sp.]HBS35359.1 DNA mismatch repair protein MutT [Parvularcula sp.]
MKHKKIGPWTVNSAREVYRNPWISVADYAVTRPDGAPGQYGVVSFANLAIGVLPIDDEGQTMLVGQHRFPHDAYSWELPEGGGDIGVDPRLSAERELLEETGYRAAHWLEFASFDISNSVTDEKSVCFLAWGLTPGAPAPGPDEVLAHRRISFNALHEMALKGDIRDSLTIIMTLKARALAEAGALPAEVGRLLLTPR